MGGFCGKDDHAWIADTLGPCYFNPAAAVLLAAAAAASLLLQGGAARRLTAAAAARGAALPRGSGAVAHAQLAAAAVLMALHGFALLWSATQVPQPPYVVLSESFLLVTWGAFVALLFYCRRLGGTPRLKPLLWTAVLLYTVGLYSEIQFYAHGMGMNPAERRFRLSAAFAMEAAVLLMLAAEHRKPPPTSEEEALLMEALLGGDVEAPATGKQRKHSWLALVGIAARYMWPDTVGLQIRAWVCVAMVVVLRLLNLAVPILYKKVVDEFAYASAVTHPQEGEPRTFSFKEVFFPWVLAYMVTYFFQGGSGGGAVGLVSNLRSYLWIPISQNSYRRATLDTFSHVLGMDLNFHLHRKTGELLRIMDRGTNSIQTMLSTVMFSIGPAIFDIAAASVYIALKLQPWIAIIVFVTLSGYIPMTIYLTEWRGKYRRELNRLDNAKGAKATDALLNYETVKLFNNEALERRNFADAIDAYQVEDYKLSASMNALNVAQSVVIYAGMASGLLVCTQGIADGSLTVGDAVLFVTLMQQLYGPLNFFGTYYRMIQQAMLDMENMFDLLGQHPALQDKPGAAALAPRDLTVAFHDVCFQYSDGAPVLKNVSFTVPGGSTVALVGATGSGKSTILRLLFRFYDPQMGAIIIDGQNIADVTQASLRAQIGVVPQDTVLFNDTIRYNIKYAKPHATDEEVVEAAQAACIHETIVNRFPLQYDTVVGERGLRLSGGEKQRVAFARAILKNPPILILDEATSALDSITEKRIQAALADRRTDRTVVIVAHRLSTIMDADAIIVLNEGEIIERGTHTELTELGGLYAEMWRRQQETAAQGAPSSAAASRAASRATSSAALSQLPGAQE
ncbi:ATP-binding cassette sub-family B member mitochondrial [Micractinium conductrix]|uniref:ATP-binding cassette sub-family B member mitochondrial n=1 Tax=Micractinium conductrix TaxID=554055 RepID=A0A2P6VCG8_9CHLO|nr:ATP-binding cassette sub-family B member mitochondrial [Micractinium conductrix]|eukprot:PSC71777.1 ATP-binding cassette sub-family B member mitochondrial [Micractinium conductrix]